MNEADESSSELGLDALWAGLLSQKPARIRAIWGRLATPERAAILAHLRMMAAGEGWQSSQREAARSALEALEAPGGDAPPRT